MTKPFATMVSTQQSTIFLSHAHEDKELATKLATQIEKILSLARFNIQVFNTSEPQWRFEQLNERLRPGASHENEARRWESELKNYIRRNLLLSLAYLFLVTKRSIEKNSAWLAYEIRLARKEDNERGLRFIFPCFFEESMFKTGSFVPLDPSLIQGIDFARGEGIDELARSIVDLLRRDLAMIKSQISKNKELYHRIEEYKGKLRENCSEELQRELESFDRLFRVREHAIEHNKNHRDVSKYLSMEDDAKVIALHEIIEERGSNWKNEIIRGEPRFSLKE